MNIGVVKLLKSDYHSGLRSKEKLFINSKGMLNLSNHVHDLLKMEKKKGKKSFKAATVGFDICVTYIFEYNGRKGR